MFEYHNSFTRLKNVNRMTRFLIKEQDIQVGMVDVIEFEWPQLKVQIIVYKAYADNFKVLYKYKRDVLELLEYETGMHYMPVKSESVCDNLDYIQMDLELHYHY
jgi:hypothetical protein